MTKRAQDGAFDYQFWQPQNKYAKQQHDYTHDHRVGKEIKPRARAYNQKQHKFVETNDQGMDVYYYGEQFFPHKKDKHKQQIQFIQQQQQQLQQPNQQYQQQSMLHPVTIKNETAFNQASCAFENDRNYVAFQRLVRSLNASQIDKLKPYEDVYQIVLEHVDPNQPQNLSLTIKIRIDPREVSTDNPKVKNKKLYGDKVYMCSSDIVAVIFHMGYYSHLNQPLKHYGNLVQDLRVHVKVVRGSKKYISKIRNSVTSNSYLPMTSELSIQVIRCFITTHNQNEIELEANFNCPAYLIQPSCLTTSLTYQHNITDYPQASFEDEDNDNSNNHNIDNDDNNNNNNIQYQMFHRVLRNEVKQENNQQQQTGDNNLQNQSAQLQPIKPKELSRKDLEANNENEWVSIKFSKSNDVWLSYNLNILADRGTKHSQWTGVRFAEEVMYLEDDSDRYELCCPFVSQELHSNRSEKTGQKFDKDKSQQRENQPQKSNNQIESSQLHKIEESHQQAIQQQASDQIQHQVYQQKSNSKDNVDFNTGKANRAQISQPQSQVGINPDIQSSQIQYSDQQNQQLDPVQLYLAQNKEREQVAKIIKYNQRQKQDQLFRFNKVLQPLPMDQLKVTGSPLPNEMTQTIIDNITWEDISWAENGVVINNQHYAIDRIIFVPRIPSKNKLC